MTPPTPAQRARDRARAIAWARTLLQQGSFVIVDTETTGLGATAEVIAVAVLGAHGQVLLDALVRPYGPIPAAASAVHGLTPLLVAGAVSFPLLHRPLVALVRGRIAVAYNAAFDRRILAQTCARYRLPPLTTRWTCALHAYAAFQGDWHPVHSNYRWPPLPEGDHAALGDCRATLRLIHRMAEAVP